ncbi:hypothetical protein [Diaphorobacter aerolatus]|uniref:Uncharacterized protein n=1 Tax=Diaphorobacter aerolatus TaxID=1288495 RepID=A0A7H0GJ86_9BURK|nr:hypothetical protein [Diaphorobacter aerolatus]QNP48352.1 hypothetical protein H9K75_20755 [Diaphorobacter aerolatus]
MKHITIAVLVALSLVACGEKKEEPKPVAAAPAADNKPAEPAVLKASFEVPEKFRGYTDMVASYTNNEKEFRALPDSIFKDYKTAWEKQSYSIDKPDWYFAAVIQNPKLAEMTNDFKKQEAGEQVKATLTPDKNSLNVIVSANNEMQVLMDKPDIQTGIYKVNVTPKGVRSTVNQEFNGVRFGYGYELFYKEPLGLELPDCSGCKKLVALNVKVPLDKAKEIEEWREKGQTPCVPTAKWYH